MTNKCLVCGYRSRAGDGLSFHRFPDNIQRRQQWMNALNLEHANKWHYVCGKHFQPYDYEVKKSGQRILKRDAVPVSHEFGPIQEELSGTVEEEVVLMTEPSTSEDQVIESIVAHPFTRTISQTTISSERTVTACDSDSCTLTASEVGDGFFVETDEVNKFKIPETRKRKNESSTSSPSSSKSSSSPHRGPGSISDSTLSPTKSDSTRVPLTKRIKIVRKSYFGDINSEDLASPSKARKAFGIARKTISTYRRKMRTLQKQNRRTKARVMNLKSLLDHLLHKKLLSNSALESIEALLPVPVADVVKRILKGSKSEQYSPSLRAFALTLHFYSPRAYNYVRETFNKALPHPSTVSKWYQNINGSPGFTTESLAAIKDRVEQNKLKGKATYANLVMDEMSIRKKVEWVENRFIGFVDFGSDVDSDSLPEAKEVLVFLITSVNGCWKIPVGYFCIDGLSGTERSNLVKNCLTFLNESGVIITSLTFDGAASNIAMAKQLGADFSDVNNMKTYFDHPVTKHKVFIFLDICHMMKLVRNCLGDFKILKTTNNNTINWHYLDELVNLQTTEGLSAAPKIKRRHMQYAKEKMRVKIATQTFSKSVHDALIFLEHDLGLNNFRGAEYTANFCLLFNDLFDILNSRSKFAAYIFKRGFSSETETIFLQKFKEMKEFILSLSLRDVPVTTSSRKTGFIGFLVGMESFNGIYETYVKSGELKFLLGYKFSQDHLETFFSCVRSMHGFNNNPSCRQFQSAYKKLLVSKEVRGADTGNAINLDNTLILHVSSRKITINDDKEDIQASAEYKKLCEDLDNHDFFSSTGWQISSFLEDVITYISGFVVKSLKKCITCGKCLALLESGETTSFLQKRKSFGNLIKASSFVTRICIHGERTIRQMGDRIFSPKYKNVINIILNKTISDLPDEIFRQFGDHVYDGEFLDNHQVSLVKLILTRYFTIRMHHETRKRSDTIKNRVRSVLTHLILYQNQ